MLQGIHNESNCLQDKALKHNPADANMYINNSNRTGTSLKEFPHERILLITKEGLKMHITNSTFLSIKLHLFWHFFVFSTFSVCQKQPVCLPVMAAVSLSLIVSVSLTRFQVCQFVFQPSFPVSKSVRMRQNWVRMFGGAEKTCDAWPRRSG